MDDRKDILSEGLRNRLKDYRHPVEKDIWSRIEKDLEIPSGKKKVSLFAIVSAVAAVALFLIGIGIFFIKEEPAIEMMADENIIYPEGIEKNIRQSFSLPFSEVAEDFSVEKNNRQQKRKKEQKRNFIEEQNDSDLILSADIPDEIPEKKKTGAEPSLPDADVIEKNKQPEKKNKKDEWLSYKQENSFVLPTRKKRNLSFGLALGNSALASNQSIHQRYYLYNQLMDFSIEIIESNAQLTIENKNAQVNTTEIDYKLPFTVGVTVRKELSDKWALESGLMYTYLSSTEKEKHSGNEISKKDVRLNYLGIPVKGIYSLYQTGNISLYVAGGGMLEKSVYGKEVYDNGNSNSLNVSEIQASIFTNIGVNIKLIDHFGLFLEPGVIYYFDDGSEVETIRKDRPFNFNFQGGIRFTY
ncbi:MAG: PorT family protein [Candidatus Azobacteroides sp.]|nr:PorT family protein [Candidatus Azobacteroides sp.]